MKTSSVICALAIFLSCGGDFDPDLSSLETESAGTTGGSTGTGKNSSSSTSTGTTSTSTSTSTTDGSTTTGSTTTSSTSTTANGSSSSDTTNGGSTKKLDEVCHPLLDECEGTLVCVGPMDAEPIIGSKRHWICRNFEGVTDGLYGDDCTEGKETIATCQTGFRCVAPEFFPGMQCGFETCCTNYCWTKMDCMEGAECYEMLGAEYDNLTDYYKQWAPFGLCVIPPP